MGAAAVKVSEACGYVNAGTVEFLYQDGEFYFLEMNTRLQVEHPVTELVTGLDLVAWQLKIASGEALTFNQSEIKREGHSIEVRINAEDPSGGRFTPSPGTLSRFTQPSGPGVRLDAGYESGDTVSQYYDNLIAKLIVWHEDREGARRRMLRALEETKIEGVATTIPAAEAILSHADFAEANYSTKWVEETLDLSGLTVETVAPEAEDGSAKVLRTVTTEVAGRRYDIKLWLDEASLAGTGGSAPKGSKPKRRGGGGTVSAAASGSVTVPMQGTIVKVLVEPGDEVEVGQTIVVLEAMKMENSINASVAGTVKEVRVSVGDSVTGNDVVAIIE